MKIRVRVCLWSVLALLGSCQDLIAPIDDSAQVCVADSDCPDSFFCTSGRCLRAGGMRCGNGQIEGEERCDDGNRNNNDYCLNTCVRARCGDGVHNRFEEDCDQGRDNSDEPNAECRTDCGARRCGDGIIDDGEDCDDGNNEDDDDCPGDCGVDP